MLLPQPPPERPLATPEVVIPATHFDALALAAIAVQNRMGGADTSQPPLVRFFWSAMRLLDLAAAHGWSADAVGTEQDAAYKVLVALAETNITGPPPGECPVPGSQL